MRRVYILLLSFGLCAMAWTRAQSVTREETKSSPYLLRLERGPALESVCVLLNANGQYHLERHTLQKVRVFEGTVEAAELSELVHILSGDLLFHLEQKQIPDMLLKADDDHVILEIHRPAAWQQLVFTDSASREPFRDALDPLLKWLAGVNKRKGRKISEEAGRNNCLPPSRSEFSKRPAPPPADSQQKPDNDPWTMAENPAPPGSYALLMFEKRQHDFQPHRSCLLVTTSGGFHLVTQTNAYGKGLSSAVLDGTLTPPQFAALRSILDDPELLNDPEEKHTGEIMMTSEGYYTRLFIPRGATTQKVAAWKSYRIVDQVMTNSVEDHGTKLLSPLWQWLKDNIDQKSAVSTPVPPNPRCVPGG